MLSIVEELRTNRESGARRLEAEYKAGLMTLARRLCDDEGDAEELVNSTFADVIEGIDDYLEQSAFFGWMCKILENRFAKEKRRKSNRTVVAVGEAVDGAVDESGADRIVQGVDAALLRDAIDGLPDEMKEALMLRYFMGLPVARVAKLLSVPEGTAKWRLHCARMILAAKLGVAAQKPGVKALLIALALAALTAIGAAVVAAVGGGETDHSTAIDGSQEFSTAIGSRLQSAADDGYRNASAAGSRQQSAADDGLTTPDLGPRTQDLGLGTFNHTTGDTMNATTATRTAAMLAAATLATGAPFTANADDYIWNVAEGQTETIDASGVTAIGAKNLVKTGRGKLISSADMAAYTGTITVREGAFEIKTTSDLGTADGGTVVEDGGTLVVNMSSGQERFSNESFTIEGTGDAAYGAAVYQPKSNDRFKLFKYLTLSDDATIYAGTRLGVDGGTLTMNGHTLTVKGVNFQMRDVTYASPIGSLVVEANLTFVRNQTAAADATKTLTVGNGGRIGFAESYATPAFWTLVVEDGGKVVSSTTSTFTWGGNVVWNAATEDGVTGLLTFTGEVTGTGTIKASTATLTFVQQLGAGVGLGLSGTAKAVLKGCSYSNKGMMTGKRIDGWSQGFNTDRGDTSWSYCAYGPGPQLVRDSFYWDEADTHSNGKARMWCSRGYLWNREATNVTYTVFVGSVYENWIYLDGDYNTYVYYNKRDSWGSCTITVPAQSCRQIDIRTSDGKSYGGPRTDNDKAKINGVIANDPSGYYFTTNAVSVLENTPALTTLTLADDGVIDASNLPMSVADLVGGAVVTHVTTLSVSNSWTLAAADIMAGATLEVDGDLAFGNGCAFSVTNLRSLPTSEIYTVCTADSITGFTSGTSVVDRGRKWSFTLSSDGKSITLQNVPQSTVLYVR